MQKKETPNPSSNLIAVSSPSLTYGQLWAYRYKRHRKKFLALIATIITICVTYTIFHAFTFIRSKYAYAQVMQGHTYESLHEQYLNLPVITRSGAQPFIDDGTPEKFFSIIEQTSVNSSLIDQITINHTMFGEHHYVINEVPTPKASAIVKQILQPNSPILDQLKSVRNVGPIKYQVTFDGYEPPIKHPVIIFYINRASLYLHLRAIQKFHANDTAAAIDDLVLIIQLLDTISQLPSIHTLDYYNEAIGHYVYPVIRECLKSQRLTSEQMKQLQDALTRYPIHIKAIYPLAIRFSLLEAQSLEDSRLKEMNESDFDDPVGYLTDAFWRFTAVYNMDHCNVYDLTNLAIEQVESGNYDFTSLEDSIDEIPEIYQFSQANYSHLRFVIHLVLSKKWRNKMIHELAGARYQLDHDQPLQSDDDLVPEYLSHIPEHY